jgi:hypothetical protein
MKEKSFITLTAVVNGVNVIKLFKSLMMHQNKLECLTLESFLGVPNIFE